MKVFLIGGTGFLGTHLISRLKERNDEITVLTRSAHKAHELESNGVRSVIGDLLNSDSFVANVAPQDVVISAAMPEIRPGRISRKRFKILRDRTTAYISTPIAVAEKLRCPLIVTLGTSFRTKGDEVADESWPIDRFGMTRIGEFADVLISEASQRGSPPLVQMLPGQIYGPGGLFQNFMYDWMKKGKYRVIGSGKNCIPRIHVEDCAGAYVRALEKMPLGERFIIADDEPCTSREFADFMADCMNVPRPKSIPAFIVRIVIGKLLYETATMNCRVTNAKVKKYLNWSLKYPTYREGLPAAISAIGIKEPTKVTGG